MKVKLLPKNEDQESLVEEIEEYNEMVNSSCPQMAVSYDVLAHLEESYKNIKDNNY